MLKLTKKADYGLIAMKHLAEHGERCASAKDLADTYGIPQEALAKILQRLVRAGLLLSQQGTKGGYVLSRNPRQISALEVIRVIDGPLLLTACSEGPGDCAHETLCTVREPLRKVSLSIQQVLAKLSIWDLREPELSAAEKQAHTGSSELVTLGAAMPLNAPGDAPRS